MKPSLNLDEIFSPKGILHSRLPHYEYRPSQLTMAKAVLRAIEQRRHLCVEAGTGTGKTLAYLIPALFSCKRVVISTATRNLQEQLFYKDIPFVKQHLFPQLAASCMKGRQNYLCLKRFMEQKTSLHMSDAEAQLMANLFSWVSGTRTGDRSEVSWLRDEEPLWKDIDARSEHCVGQKCPQFEQCYITQMRRQALEANIIIVNHSLLFSHLALQTDEIGKILPDYSVLILDEGHEIEDIATSHFGRQLSNYQIEEFCRDFWKTFAASSDQQQDVQRIEHAAQELFALLPLQEGRHSLNYFRASDGEIVDIRSGIANQASRLKSSLEALLYRLLQQGGLEADAISRRLEQLVSSIQEIFTEEPENIYWFERRGRGVFLHMTPIDVAEILREKLFKRTDSVILTSATLTTGQDFNYLRGRLGLDDSDELMVPSEFDYATQTILYLPAHLPEPGTPGYFPRILSEIRRILEITEGHAFLLFTSTQQMNRVYDSLVDGLPYPVFRQGDQPKTQLLELFKTTPNAILCATASFWQGVDVQGDALRAVIVDKLPFLVPTEPVAAARLSRLERLGQNSFLSYVLPEAIINLKQGLGRLIRSRQDRGILAIFDSRLHRRSYGPLFLRSLPNCPLTDNIEDLKNFFMRDKSH
ncbi:MAG: ATP-dependent DNA helicase [Acidobacteria bacterium]|nr:ATP-dependent DNA helicase [Acidobacteriota bacterium]